MRYFLLICILCVSCLEALADPASPRTEYVDQKLLLRYLSDRRVFTLVDARSTEEYLHQHINGAINIPHDQFEEFKRSLPADPSSPILVYCRTGRRAGLLKDILEAAGYSDIRVLPAEQIFWSAEAPPVFNCGFSVPSLEQRLLSDKQNPSREHPSIEEN